MTAAGSLRRLRWAATALCVLVGCATGSRPITKLVNGRVVVTRSVDPTAYEHAARAELYELEERWEEAATALSVALSFDSGSPELHARRAEVLLHQGKIDDADDDARAALEHGDSVVGLTALAHVRQARGDTAGAVTALQRAVAALDQTADSDEVEAGYLELADAEILALDVAGSLRTLTRLADLAPQSLIARTRAGAAAWALGELGEAETRYRQALLVEPNQLDALLALAWLYAGSGRVADARRAFADALERSEGALEIAAAYARFLMTIGAADDARQLADDVGGNDASREALPRRLELERAVKRPDRVLALAALTPAADATQPSRDDVDGERAVSIAITLARGQALVDQGKRALAVTHYLALGKDDPAFIEARLRAAALLREDGNTAEARRALDQTLPTTTPSERAEIEIAIAHAQIDEKAGNPAAAAERLEQALGKHPGNVRLTMARAAVEDRRGRWQLALGIAETLIAKDPGSVEALNFWGFVAADHGHELPRALARVRAALALEPGAGGVIDSVGWAHLRAGDVARAELFLEQAGRLEPEDPEVLSHLGELYVRRAEAERAAGAFRKALSLRPEDGLRKTLEEQLRKLETKLASPR